MKIVKSREAESQENKDYWLSKKPVERLQALEIMRENAYFFYFSKKKQSIHAYNTFQKVFRVTHTAQS